MTLNTANYFVTQKAIAFGRQMNDDFTTRLSPGLTVTASTDTSGFPTISIGPGTAGSQNAFIKVSSLGSFNTDSLGLNQRVYTPHVIQIALESTTSTITSAALSLLQAVNLLIVLAECLQFGTRVELYFSANGTAPTEAAITGSPATYWDNLYQPLTSSM